MYLHILQRAKTYVQVTINIYYSILSQQYVKSSICNSSVLSTINGNMEFKTKAHWGKVVSLVLVI